MTAKSLTWRKGLLFGLAFFAVMLAGGSKASALPHSVPDKPYNYTNDPLGPILGNPEDTHMYVNMTDRDDSQGTGTRLDTSWVKVYAREGYAASRVGMHIHVQPRQVGIESACQGYHVNAWLVYIDDQEHINGNGKKLLKQIYPSAECSKDETVVVGHDLVRSALREHNGMRVALIQFEIVTSDSDQSQQHTATMQVDSIEDSGPSDTYIGMAGGHQVVLYPSLGQKFDANDLQGKPRYFLHLQFQVNCDYDGTAGPIRWSGEDTGNDGKQLYRIEVSLNGPGGGQYSPEASQATPTGGWQAGASYTFNFNHLQGGNGVAFTLPFDIINFKYDCNAGNPSVGQTTCVEFPGNNGTVTLNDNAHYRFTLFGNSYDYKPSRASSVGTPHSTILGWSDFSIPPDKAGISYQSPVVFTSQSQYDGVISYNAGTRHFKMDYPDPNGPDRMLYIESWTKGSDNKWRYDVTSTTFDNCYRASCSLTFYSNIEGSGNGVQAGQYFAVKGTITNTGQWSLPMSTRGKQLGITGEPDSAFAPSRPLSGATHGLAPGQTDTFYWILLAPNDIGSYKLAGYPDYFGNFALGSTCNAVVGDNGPPSNVETFQHFTLTPHANIKASPTIENPAAIEWPIGVTQEDDQYKGTVLAGLGGILYRNNLPVTSANYSGNYGNANYDPPIYHPGVVGAGEHFCAQAAVNPGRGWIGPGGRIADKQIVITNQPCFTVVNEPYTHFYGSDVMAGGGFMGTNGCAPNTLGVIDTYTNTIGTLPRGSGTQFGAQALGLIEGFNSANLRTSTPTGSSGLTFSNRSDIASGTQPPNPRLGGQAGVGGMCFPDYYGDKDKQAAHSTDRVNNTGVGGQGARFYKPPSGTLTIHGGAIGNGINQAIYVDGDVYIDNDIKYAAADHWNSVNHIPSLYVIAKGNIIVDKDVKQLDGVYIAQPKSDGSRGIINTCGIQSGAYILNLLLNNCKKQLIVSGAFVAKRIYLNRTYSSLRYSGPDGSVHSCGVPGVDVPADGPISSSDCSAEIFLFSPEVFMAQPAIPVKSGPSQGGVDYITSLAPVL